MRKGFFWGDENLFIFSWNFRLLKQPTLILWFRRCRSRWGICSQNPFASSPLSHSFRCQWRPPLLGRYSCEYLNWVYESYINFAKIMSSKITHAAYKSAQSSHWAGGKWRWSYTFIAVLRGRDVHKSIFCDRTNSWWQQKLNFQNTSINILHVLKFIFKNVRPCKLDTHKKYGSQVDIFSSTADKHKFLKFSTYPTRPAWSTRVPTRRRLCPVCLVFLAVTLTKATLKSGHVDYTAVRAFCPQLLASGDKWEYWAGMGARR